MHLHARRARRLALALAVPIVALGAIALSANTATSATTAVIQPTDQPDGGSTDGGGGGGGGTDTSGPTGGGTTGGPTTTTRTSPNPTTSSKSPTPTPTPTTKSPTPSPSRTAGGGGGVGGACAKPTTGPTTVKVATINGKQALVDNNGCTLYLNTNDTPDASACDAQCLVTWWPLLAPGTAGSGVQQANLSAFTRTGGVNQVTYFTHQLYRYSGDAAPGDAKGQGQNQTWYLVDPSGNAITS
jgi:predicted lipoprotein with Yx(FWY)xxD motif